MKDFFLLVAIAILHGMDSKIEHFPVKLGKTLPEEIFCLMMRDRLTDKGHPMIIKAHIIPTAQVS